MGLLLSHGRRIANGKYDAVPRCRVTISLTFAVLASFATWLVLSEESPFDNYFLYHVTWRNLIGRLVFVPYVLTLLLGPAFWADQISYAFIFAQWLVVGFVVSIFVFKNGRS